MEAGKSDATIFSLVVVVVVGVGVVFALVIVIVVVVIVVVVLVRVLVLLVDGPAGSTMCSKISIPRLRAVCTGTHTNTHTSCS